MEEEEAHRRCLSYSRGKHYVGNTCRANDAAWFRKGEEDVQELEFH
jgi:hypothetical protein